jgi:hypothetical protein
MTDQELLELAAKAAGLTILRWPQKNYAVVDNGGQQHGWSPLDFDSDALRLAVKLGLSVHLRPLRVEVISWPKPTEPVMFGFDDGEPLPVVKAIEPLNDDPYAATRRAIVTAAAEIGREME